LNPETFSGGSGTLKIGAKTNPFQESRKVSTENIFAVMPDESFQDFKALHFKAK
jgi:hypothetical protein